MHIIEDVVSMLKQLSHQDQKRIYEATKHLLEAAVERGRS